MIRTALLALIVGTLATGCVVTTGGAPSNSSPTHSYKVRGKSRSHSNHGGSRAAATPGTTQPGGQSGGGEAVATPPVVTPTTEATPTTGTTPTPGMTTTQGLPSVHQQSNPAGTTTTGEEQNGNQPRRRLPKANLPVLTPAK